MYQAPYCSVTEDAGITSDGLICQDPNHTFCQRETQAGAGRGEGVQAEAAGHWEAGPRGKPVRGAGPPPARMLGPVLVRRERDSSPAAAP